MITKLQITGKLHYHRKCDFQLSKKIRVQNSTSAYVYRYRYSNHKYVNIQTSVVHLQ